MSWRLIRILLMFLILISLAVWFTHGAEPTGEQVEALWNNNPQLVVSMVQKLYVLEHATPVLGLPDLQIFELDDGSTRVLYDGVMTLHIGDDTRNLEYEIELKPKEVTIGYTPEKQTPWGWIAVGGVLVFVGGLVTGVLATR